MHIWCILQFYAEAGKWGHLAQYNQEFPQLFCFWIEWKRNDIVQLKMFLNWMKAQWLCSTQNASELNENTMTLFNSLQPSEVNMHHFINILRPRQNGRHLSDDTFRCIFLNENVWILIKISLKFVPKGRINNIPALVQIMAWHRPGHKPLSEPMMVSLLTHICVTRPQWVKQSLVQKMVLTCPEPGHYMNQ